MGKIYRHRILDAVSLADLSFDGDGSQVSWHKIALVGKWDGHPMGGFSITRDQLRQMAEYHQAKRTDTVVDYEHSTLFSSTGKAPAAAWIDEMEVRDSEEGQASLWARFSWTTQGAEHVRNREYRYLSPVIVFNTCDRKDRRMIGASIHSVALTNTPFLQELPDVRLNSLPFFELEEEKMNDTQYLELCKKLQLSEGAPLEQVMARIATLVAQSRVAACALNKLSCTPDDLEATIIELKRPRDDSELIQLREENAQLKQANAQRDAEDLVARYLSDGKILPNQKDWAMEYALSDRERFEKFVESCPRQGPKEKQSKRNPGADVDIGDEQRRANRAMGLTDEDVAKYGNVDIGQLLTGGVS